MSSTTQTPAPAPPGGNGGDARRKRLASYTVRNMILSVLPILGLALVWWAFTHNPQEPQPRAVEVEMVANHAAYQSDWPVWVPGPGEGWTPTVAYFEPRVADVLTWHVSFMTPEGEYVAISQAADVTAEWSEQVLSGGTQVGQETLESPAGEHSWAAHEGPRPSNAEVARVLGPEHTGGSTVVVHGTVGQAELEEFLGSVQVRDS